MTVSKKLNLLVVGGDEFKRDITETLKVPPEFIKKIAKCVNTARGIRVIDQDQVVAAWSGSQLPPETLQKMISVLRHLFDEAVKAELDVNLVLSELKDYCINKKIDGFDERRASLKTFLTPKKQYIENRNFVPFQYGVVNNLSTISAVVQLRAAFQDKDSTDILGYIPILQVRMTSESDHDKGGETFNFQTNLKGLDKLIKDLNNYKKQLQTVQKSLKDSVKIYAPK